MNPSELLEIKLRERRTGWTQIIKYTMSDRTRKGLFNWLDENYVTKEEEEKAQELFIATSQLQLDLIDDLKIEIEKLKKIIDGDK